MENSHEDLVRFLCSCGKKLKVSRKFLGKFGKCPRCGKEIKIPEDKFLLPPPASDKNRPKNNKAENDVAPLPPLLEGPNEAALMSDDFTVEVEGIQDNTNSPNSNLDKPKVVSIRPALSQDTKTSSVVSKLAKLLPRDPLRGSNLNQQKILPRSAHTSAPTAIPEVNLEESLEDPATLMPDSTNIDSQKDKSNVSANIVDAFYSTIAEPQEEAIPAEEAENMVAIEATDIEEVEELAVLATTPSILQPSPTEVNIAILEEENVPVIQTYEVSLPRALPVINPPIIQQRTALATPATASIHASGQAVPVASVLKNAISSVSSMNRPSEANEIKPAQGMQNPKSNAMEQAQQATPILATQTNTSPAVTQSNESSPTTRSNVAPVPTQTNESSNIKSLSDQDSQYDSSSHPEVAGVEETPEKDVSIDIKKLLADAHIKGGELLMQGKIALESTNFEEALHYFCQCIDKSEDIGLAYYLRALLYVQKKVFLLALEDLHTAQDFECHDIDIEDIRNRVLLQQATIYRNMGAYREAGNLLKEIVSKDIDIEKAKIHWTKAKFLIQQGAAVNALHDIEEAIRLKYLRPEVFEARGRIYLDQGDYASALHDFVSAINRGGKSATLYHVRSEVHFFLKDYDAALNDIHVAQNLAPENAIFYDFEALILNEKKMYEASDLAFERSFGLEPENPIHHFNRGLCYMRRGKYERAIDDFSKVIEANPKDHIALFKRAICYQEKSNPNLALAREDFKKVEQLEQGSVYRSTSASKKRKIVR